MSDAEKKRKPLTKAQLAHYKRFQMGIPEEREIQHSDVGRLLRATDYMPLLSQLQIASNLMFNRFQADGDDMDARAAYVLLRRCEAILDQNPKAAQLKLKIY